MILTIYELTLQYIVTLGELGGTALNLMALNDRYLFEITIFFPSNNLKVTRSINSIEMFLKSLTFPDARMIWRAILDSFTSWLKCQEVCNREMEQQLGSIPLIAMIANLPRSTFPRFTQDCHFYADFVNLPWFGTEQSRPKKHPIFIKTRVQLWLIMLNLGKRWPT